MQAELFPLKPLPGKVIPSFEQVVAELRRVPAILYDSLEGAAYKVRTYRDAECPDERLDGGLSASIFRLHSLRGLKREGIDAEQDEFKWTFDRLPFLGISFFYRRHHIRVLKGRNGIPPGCGNSAKKRRFFGQTSSFYLEKGKAQRSDLNLIVLWDFDFHYGLSNLWLGCPAVGGVRPNDVRMYWLEPLPHPEVVAHPTTVTIAPQIDQLDQMIRLIGDGDDEEKANEG